jgi:hypothetical protein
VSQLFFLPVATDSLDLCVAPHKNSDAPHITDSACMESSGFSYFTINYISNETLLNAQAQKMQAKQR